MAGYVFIGDDFTGASDTLATLAERGYASRLLIGMPGTGSMAGLDAVGIATDLRAQPPDVISERLASFAPAVKALSPRIVHYKVCSTFDSAPHVGSIGAAVAAIEFALRPVVTVILGGQPSLGRYCLGGNLFARAADGEIYRIDRHPVMSRHPVTPMDEADLSIHLGRQGLDDLVLIDRSQLQTLSPAELAGRLSRHARSLVDAVDQSDVDQLGAALHMLASPAGPALVVGASSVAEGLPRTGQRSPSEATGSRAGGPRLAIAGSRSQVTAAQIAAARSYEKVPLAASDLESGFDVIVARCAEKLAGGRNVLVHLKPDTDYCRSALALNDGLAALSAAIVARQPLNAIAVAGGDTSSAVVERLGVASLSFVGRAGVGVAICRGHAPGAPVDGVILLLKGGQVGDELVFERFLA